MADVRPFRALRFDPSKAGDLSSLLSPPFDVISPQGREELYGRSPYNVVRLEFGRPEAGDDGNANVYTRAAALLEQWHGDGVLIRDETPAYYLVAEEYQAGPGARPDGVKQRLGLYAGVRLEEYERGVVLPHEQTRPGPKEDRLRLMEACEAVFSPLMLLYRDSGGQGPLGLRSLLLRQMEAGPPELTASHGGVRYRLWSLREPELVQRVQEAFAATPLYLVDGHHRYETALTYRDARRAGAGGGAPDTAAYNYRLVCLIDMQDPGSRLLSFHRLLCGLTPGALNSLWGRTGELFDVQSQGPVGVTGPALEEALQALERLAPDTPAFGLLDAASGELFHLTLKADLPGGALPPAPVPDLGRCETWLLHQAVLDPVVGAAAEEPKELSFLHDLEEVAGRLAAGGCQLLFLVRPMRLELFESLVRQGQLLPPKATYFDPKLPTGLVMQKLDGDL